MAGVGRYLLCHLAFPGNVLSLATAPVFMLTIITVVYGKSGNTHRDFGTLPLNGNYVTND